jgi:hypothetical protein
MRRRVFIIFTVVLIAACAAIYFAQIPYNCPSKTIFGIYCSACGIMRAARSLLALQIGKAFCYNQFFILSVPLYIYAYAGWGIKVFFNVRIFPPKKYIPIFLAAYFLLFLIYGILRNFEAFEILAPHEC